MSAKGQDVSFSKFRRFIEMFGWTMSLNAWQTCYILVNTTVLLLLSLVRKHQHN